MNNFFYGVLVCSVMCLLSACSDKIQYTDGPYTAAPKPGISFEKGYPLPTIAKEGDHVVFGVNGLNPDTSVSEFYINRVRAKVISLKDSLLTLEVPFACTSGALQIITNGGEYYSGPILSIYGNIDVDPTFNVGAGTNGEILDAIQDGNYYMIVGSFSSYQGYPTKATDYVSRIAKINALTAAYQYDSRLDTFTGASGTISSLIKMPDGRFIVGGSFGSYNKKIAVNVTRLTPERYFDSVPVHVLNVRPDAGSNNDAFVDTVVPAFSSYLTAGRGGVVKVFKDPTLLDKFIAVGNFGSYNLFDYLVATTSVFPYYSTQVSQFIRLSYDGIMDSSFNYNPATKQSYSGVSGNVGDAIQLSSGKIIITGSFNSFNGQPVGNIAALSATGQLDATFNAGKQGADGEITKITYNSNTHKILIVGNFQSYNGVTVKSGVAMLNEDGSLDQSFTIQAIEGGYITYAGQLDNGLILAAGTFSQYNGIVRQGFMFLEKDGSLAGHDGVHYFAYNNTGAFSGRINKIIEGKTSQNYNCVTIMGNFSLFDNTQYQNIVRIRFLN